ncbi:hypothetical protein FD04_GL002243 [Secundilactobacillus odoratitofui DSM 19909 = JCM 15043]|uniref:DUF3784 domain-containing protein n=1 Tax=Secundilactobacillus odoratitofui DSM 19909 = JCM 15043 TaxID=1423776 RepID=A0A0R1M4Z8_9LACO|nr:hypothetical protein [Secundilactobacillus odoratitofui]KRK99426.1 hypothetical protein FD04_GL002243 [Secundilactobacillus odoratitofui DSM 19909 = JCM 15043]
MLINILMIVFILLTFFIGGFFLTHTNKAFLVFHPESNRNLAGIVKFGGWSLIIIGVVACVATVMQNNVFISMTLLVAVLDIVAVQLMLVHFFPKNQ